MKREKTRSQIALEQEQENFRKGAERVRELLMAKKAEDLIPMVLDGVENYKPIRELASSPNERRG